MDLYNQPLPYSAFQFIHSFVTILVLFASYFRSFGLHTNKNIVNILRNKNYFYLFASQRKIEQIEYSFRNVNIKVKYNCRWLATTFAGINRFKQQLLTVFSVCNSTANLLKRFWKMILNTWKKELKNGAILALSYVGSDC